MKVTVENHPSPKLHPLTGEVMKDKDGNQIPAFEDHKCIKLDGAIIGYILPDNTASFILPKASLGKTVLDEVQKAAKATKSNFTVDSKGTE